MSDDLISRSALMQSLRNNVLVDVTPNLERAIEEQPVAYDVDKAVLRLKGLNMGGIGMVEDGEYHLIRMEEAIEVVKAGMKIDDKEKGRMQQCEKRKTQQPVPARRGDD